ncbi:vegetative cell wall protein gp1-like [Penaeus monodon]|uniref:vegetative cell wall protein gp1-like n=1 Tax=Penaeus monodon TaxID=6687 RepID=UPI0018A7C6C6|nr:vegetative cell wall protein gp1-like [Penaeus monodon]
MAAAIPKNISRHSTLAAVPLKRQGSSRFLRKRGTVTISAKISGEAMRPPPPTPQNPPLLKTPTPAGIPSPHSARNRCKSRPIPKTVVREKQYSAQAPVSQSPALRSPASQSPVPQSPASQSPVPQSLASQSPAPRSPAFQSPAPRSPAFQSPAPRSSAS